MGVTASERLRGVSALPLEESARLLGGDGEG